MNDTDVGWFQQDPRTIGWFASGSKSFIIFVVLAYVWLVKAVLPRYMKNRPPLENLIPIIRCYNLSMVLVNVWFVTNLLRRTYLGGGYSLLCQGINYNAKDKTTIEVLGLTWFYIWVRIADFCDTVFFVLRKKNDHVTLLHVAHHCLVVFTGWYGITYGADGQMLFALSMNSLIHIVMYTYYFLSSFGPAVQPYLFWKRYLTQIQMLQFVAIIVHMCIPFFVSCNYPLQHTMVMVPQMLFFIVMFVQFYGNTYRATTKRKGVAVTNGCSNGENRKKL